MSTHAETRLSTKRDLNEVELSPIRLTMLRRALARLGRTLDLARLFELPERHPDRMIAASLVLTPTAVASRSAVHVPTVSR